MKAVRIKRTGRPEVLEARRRGEEGQRVLRVMLKAQWNEEAWQHVKPSASDTR